MKPSVLLAFVVVILLLAGNALANCPAASLWCSGNYSYDASGNITAIGADTYRYDAAGRLVSATADVQRTGIVSRQDYGYDQFGNRTSASRAAGSAGCTVACELTPAISSTTNRIVGATYDAAGNLTRIDDTVNGTPYTASYSFDGLSMLTQASAGADVRQFIYTADDERIAVRQGATWSWTVRGLDQKILREFSSGEEVNGLPTGNRQWVKDYVYREGQLLASRSPSGTMHFHLDHLGTPRLITDDQGVVTGQHAYYAFGSELSLTPQESTQELAKFTGHERDLVVGDPHTLDDMHARYYMASAGRFLSVDPSHPRMDQPQALNRYAYARNNPLKYIDPTGRTVGLANDCTDKKVTCQELKDLRNTVPPEMRIFVQATVKDGRVILNAGLLNMGAGRTDSGNFFALRQLANSSDLVQFRSSTATFSHYSEGRVARETFAPLTEGFGFFGLTVTSSESLSRQNQVFVNPFLSDFDRASTTAHELYGHMRLYMFGRPYEHSTKTVWDEKMQAFVPDPTTGVERVIRDRASEAERYGSPP